MNEDVFFLCPPRGEAATDAAAARRAKRLNLILTILSVDMSRKAAVNSLSTERYLTFIVKDVCILYLESLKSLPTHFYQSSYDLHKAEATDGVKKDTEQSSSALGPWPPE